MGKKRIFVIDDNKQFVEFISSALSDDYDLSAYGTAEGCLEAMEDCIPDAILLDINLPGMNGVEFVRRLSLSPKTRNIPVIVVTASDYNGITESLLRNEQVVKAFLSKLAPLEVIQEKLSAAIPPD